MFVLSSNLLTDHANRQRMTGIGVLAGMGTFLRARQPLPLQDAAVRQPLPLQDAAVRQQLPP